MLRFFVVVVVLAGRFGFWIVFAVVESCRGWSTTRFGIDYYFIIIDTEGMLFSIEAMIIGKRGLGIVQILCNCLIELSCYVGQQILLQSFNTSVSKTRGEQLSHSDGHTGICTHTHTHTHTDFKFTFTRSLSLHPSLSLSLSLFLSLSPHLLSSLSLSVSVTTPPLSPSPPPRILTHWPLIRANFSH